jgi:hypothetical protein
MTIRASQSLSTTINYTFTVEGATLDLAGLSLDFSIRGATSYGMTAGGVTGTATTTIADGELALLNTEVHDGIVSVQGYSPVFVPVSVEAVATNYSNDVTIQFNPTAFDTASTSPSDYVASWNGLDGIVDFTDYTISVNGVTGAVTVAESNLVTLNYDVNNLSVLGLPTSTNGQMFVKPNLSKLYFYKIDDNNKDLKTNFAEYTNSSGRITASIKGSFAEWTYATSSYDAGTGLWTVDYNFASGVTFAEDQSVSVQIFSDANDYRGTTGAFDYLTINEYITFGDGTTQDTAGGGAGAGNTGATGAAGPTGATGTNGTNGTNGTDGNTGAAGPTGADGATGPQGATGNDGSGGGTASTNWIQDAGNTGTWRLFDDLLGNDPLMASPWGSGFQIQPWTYWSNSDDGDIIGGYRVAVTTNIYSRAGITVPKLGKVTPTDGDQWLFETRVKIEFGDDGDTLPVFAFCAIKGAADSQTNIGPFYGANPRAGIYVGLGATGGGTEWYSFISDTTATTGTTNAVISPSVAFSNGSTYNLACHGTYLVASSGWELGWYVDGTLVHTNTLTAGTGCPFVRTNILNNGEGPSANYERYTQFDWMMCQYTRPSAVSYLDIDNL